MPLTKDETARLLADAHFQLDGSIRQVFRIQAADEERDLTPVKLLEVSDSTPEIGIRPVGMSSDPARGVFYASVIVEISPGEFEQLLRGELQLPNGWQLGPEIHPGANSSGGRVG